MLQFFYDRYGCFHARRYDFQLAWNTCTWFPEIGTTLRVVGWGSTAVWNLFKNSSDLVAWPVPKKRFTLEALYHAYPLNKYKETKILQICLKTLIQKCLQDVSLFLLPPWQHELRLKDIAVRDICCLLFSLPHRYIQFFWWILALSSHPVYCSTYSPRFFPVKLLFCINFMLKKPCFKFPKSAT